jgi:hypothetical protein
MDARIKSGHDDVGLFQFFPDERLAEWLHLLDGGGPSA